MARFNLRSSLVRRGTSNRYGERIRRNLHKGRRSDAAALHQIGFHFAKFWTLIRDLTKAYMCFTLVAQEGNDHALESRKSIAYILNDTQIANAQSMAAD